MYGAIIGDIIGSPYEFDQGDKTKDFPLFSEKSEFTDDTVMPICWLLGIKMHPQTQMWTAAVRSILMT